MKKQSVVKPDSKEKSYSFPEFDCSVEKKNVDNYNKLKEYVSSALSCEGITLKTGKEEVKYFRNSILFYKVLF